VAVGSMQPEEMRQAIEDVWRAVELEERGPNTATATAGHPYGNAFPQGQTAQLQHQQQQRGAAGQVYGDSEGPMPSQGGWDPPLREVRQRGRQGRGGREENLPLLPRGSGPPGMQGSPQPRVLREPTLDVEEVPSHFGDVNRGAC